jgi:hypothetical protein
MVMDVSKEDLVCICKDENNFFEKTTENKADFLKPPIKMW